MVDERDILEQDSQKNLEKIDQLENQISELDRAQQETTHKLGDTIKQLHERDEKIGKFHEKVNLLKSEKGELHRTSEGWNARYLSSVGKVKDLENRIKLLEETTQEMDI